MTAPLTPSRFQPRAALRAALFGLLLGSASPGFADNLPDVQRLIKQAQYPQALEKVDAYLSSKPRDAQGRFLKGIILTEMNKPMDAIAVFAKLTEDYPELPEPYNNLAVLYAQQKQYDKARSALEMAIRTHPSYAIAYENLGDIYAKLASQAYDKALQIDSGNSTAQSKMALIRDLISTSVKPNVKPPAQVAAATPPVSAPPPAKPSATVVSSTPGAAAPPPVAKSEPSAPAKSEPPAPETGAGAEVVAALTRWADAWSRKDVKAYLAHYAGDFAPKGMSRQAWETQREERIAGKPGKISVVLEAPEVKVEGDKATAKFRQHYKSSGLNSSTTKTVVLVKQGGQWLIQEENAR